MRTVVSRYRVLLGLALVAVPAAAVAVGPGCGGVAYVTCDAVYDPNRIGPDGNPDPCCDQGCPDAGHDSGDAAADASDPDAGPPACAFSCLDLPPLPWLGPVLLWTGDAAEMPECPAAAPVPTFAGFTDLDAGPASCGACACGPSSGVCGPPDHLVASTADCNGGGFTAPFDAPPGWDGSCSTFDHVGPGSKSVTSGPLTLTESCGAVTTPPAAPTEPPTFGSAAVACLGVTSPTCDQGHVCGPTDPAFRTCVYQPADVSACPALYPVRVAVAVGVDDQRACSPCTCGDVAGGSCTAILSVYSDAACALLLFSRPLYSTTAAACDSVLPPASPVGSKALTKPAYQPGACVASGGAPIGAAVPTGAATFCCATVNPPG
jgi:hypothetical protein